MKANEKPINYERPQDDYLIFECNLKSYFDTVISLYPKLYTVKVDGLWNLYLNNLPEDGRFVYDCNACRHFVERYGNLVVIDEQGVIKSALWGGAVIPDYFVRSVEAMKQAVENTGKVNGVFVSDVKTLGTPVTGIWTHMHVNLKEGMINRSRTKNAHQIMAEKLEDYKMLFNELQEYPLNVLNQAVSLLQADAMYRSNTVLGIAEWFKKVHESIDGVTGYRRTNLIWKAVGEAPTGFCHVKSSMIGTLLDDIVAGYSTRVIIARFEEKMNPQNYMRSQSAPTASAIEQAEKLVEKLGIADSLRRRYVRFDEIKDLCLWMPRSIYELKDAPVKKSGGVFANVTPKEKLNVTDPTIDIPATTMTWDKFSKTILPTASKIEVKVDNPNRFMALVTEAVSGSENILQWDNPFSWYYHGGIDGEIKRRVEAAGGRYKNCEIRCSLIWESYTDLDLHCVISNTGVGSGHIYYGHKHLSRGFLDVDANGGMATTTTPVENIRWADFAPYGHYRFFVHNYCDRNHRNNPYKVELEVGGKLYSYNGFMAGTNERLNIFEFDYSNGVVTNFKSATGTSASNTETWGLMTNEFAEVTGIVKSPNTWNDRDGAKNGEHTFFILKGCKDTSEGKGRGFFNEILKPELREIRKTLEVYSANTPIEEAESADACGVGYSVDSEWNVLLRVESNGNSRMIKIDRFD